MAVSENGSQINWTLGDWFEKSWPVPPLSVWWWEQRGERKIKLLEGKTGLVMDEIQMASRVEESRINLKFWELGVGRLVEPINPNRKQRERSRVGYSTLKSPLVLRPPTSESPSMFVRTHLPGSIFELLIQQVQGCSMSTGISNKSSSDAYGAEQETSLWAWLPGFWGGGGERYTEQKAWSPGER